MTRLIEEAFAKHQSPESIDEPIVDVSLESLREHEDELHLLQEDYARLLELYAHPERVDNQTLEHYAELPDYSQEGVVDKLQEGIERMQQKLSNKVRELFTASTKKADKLIYRGDELSERMRQLDYEQAQETVKITKANKLHISGDFGARVVSEGLDDTAQTLSEVLELYTESWDQLYNAVEEHHRALVESAETASEDENQVASFEQSIADARVQIGEISENFWQRLSDYRDQELSGGNRLQIPASEGYLKQTPDLRVRSTEREEPNSSQKVQTPSLRELEGIIETSQACAQLVRDYERQLRRVIERHHNVLSKGQSLSEALTPDLLKRLKSTVSGDEQKSAPNSLVLKAYQKEQLETIRHVQRYLLICAQSGLQYVEKALRAYK